jgi:hypothetical protein
MDFTHVLDELLFVFGSAFHFEVSEETTRHVDKRLSGPGEEPINTALGEEGGEHSSTSSEFSSNRGEGKDHVE